MNSWLHFVFHSAPLGRRILLALLFPLWSWRIQTMWKVAGGWMQGYGLYPAVGVKPPRLLREADRSMGDAMFLRAESLGQEMQELACHELTHAFSSHLRLPTWLHEGLAMVTVDRFRGSQTVRSDTLQVLVTRSMGVPPSGYPRQIKRQKDAWIYLYARGYWLTRYLVAEHPELLRELLQKRTQHEVLENRIAQAFGKERAEFWADIDAEVAAFFGNENDKTNTSVERSRDL